MRPICRFRRFFFPTLLLLAGVFRTHAVTYEVLQPGLFTVGNGWVFDSVSGSTAFTTTWQVLRTETVGTTPTVVIREDAQPYYTTDMNIYLDRRAMTIAKTYDTRYNPTQHILTTYSDPFEKIPRYINDTDSGRILGSAASSSYVVENPGQQWTRVVDQTVTFEGYRAVTVPAGVFDVVIVRVNEAWRYGDGRTGYAVRVFYIHRTIGFIAMDYSLVEYDLYGTPYYSAVSHRMRSFTSGAPELYPDVNYGSFTPNSLRAGQTLTVNWREACAFRNIAAAHQSNVVLSTDTVVTLRDTRIATVTVPALAAGQVYNASAAAVVPAWMPGGQYSVGVVLDSANAIAELDDGNNALLLSGQLEVKGKPDLTVSGATFSPSVLAPGDNLTVRATVRNLSSGSAGNSWAHVYLSADPVITVADHALITGIEVPSLGGGQSWLLDRTGTIPPTLPLGIYYVGVICDVNNAIDELREDNNVTTAVQTLTVGRPDLRVIGGTVAPASVYVGQQILVQVQIQNAGPLPAGSNWVHVYLSADTAITTGDILLQQGLQCPALLPNGVFPLNAGPAIPPVPQAGTYYVGAICDMLNQVVEAVETNNAAVVGSPIQVYTSPPDLAPLKFDVAPRTLATGSAFHLMGFVINQGGAPTGRTA
ncbi:MAG: hypothetical protein N3D11_13655, partial [Candidatus Sumerlaeia bacterium]|nr:hypothetical protein [Candidatus Sumerlaeia bacterium]